MECDCFFYRLIIINLSLFTLCICKPFIAYVELLSNRASKFEAQSFSAKIMRLPLLAYLSVNQKCETTN